MPLHSTEVLHPQPRLIYVDDPPRGRHSSDEMNGKLLPQHQVDRRIGVQTYSLDFGELHA